MGRYGRRKSGIGRDEDDGWWGPDRKYVRTSAVLLLSRDGKSGAGQRRGNVGFRAQYFKTEG